MCGRGLSDYRCVGMDVWEREVLQSVGRRQQEVCDRCM